MTDDRGQRAEGRGQRAEGRGQRADDPSSLFELRRGTQMTEGRSWEGEKVGSWEVEMVGRSEDPKTADVFPASEIR